MSFQAQPTVEGVYRIKVYGTTANAYWKYIWDGQPWTHMSVQSPWIKMTTVDESSDLFKWNVAPVAGRVDTFTVRPVSDPRIGIISSQDNRQKYWGYGYPIGIIGQSARWKIEKRGPYHSKIRCEDGSYVLDSCESTHDPIHFFRDKTDSGNQRWVFELVPSDDDLLPVGV